MAARFLCHQLWYEEIPQGSSSHRHRGPVGHRRHLSDLNRFWTPNRQQCRPYRHRRKACRSQALAIHRLLLDHFNEEFVAPLNKN